MRAAHVNLALADERLVGELLTDAWEQKAPKRLLKERLAGGNAALAGGNAAVAAGGTVPGVARRFRLGGDDLHAWKQTGLPEDAFDDWLNDRVARRHAGQLARAAYGADDPHDFVRRAILAA